MAKKISKEKIFTEIRQSVKFLLRERDKGREEFEVSDFFKEELETEILENFNQKINKEEYENVFKPFYKIDKGRADSKSSVGLGLSIASDIVRSHGGNIVLDKSKMNGLSVKIFLPV